jgi:putative aldouronate transport system substrate-binding protein
MWIYQPWLDELGLDMPETTGEFADVLAAFRNRDPNGNGEADEIPLSGAIGGGPSVQIWPFIMNSFIYTDDANYLKVDDGEVSFVASTDEWRAGLEYMRDLYDDGLIDPQAFVQQGSQLRQMGEAPTPIMGAVTALWWGNFTVHKGPSGRWEEYVALPPLEGPEGVRWARTIPLQRLQMRGAITSDAEDPRVITRFVDWFYSQEGSISLFSGVPEEHWKWADEGKEGLTGEQAIYEKLVDEGSDPTRIAWRHIMPEYGSTAIQNGIYIEDERDRWIRGRLDRTTRENYTEYRRDDVIPPTLFFPEDVAQTEAELRTQLTDSVQSFLVRFVTGDLSIENDWDAYVEQLERIGVQEYVDIYQEAYENYMSM